MFEQLVEKCYCGHPGEVWLLSTDIARPLYRLTEEQREFWWSRKCKDAFW